jgi:hypothetical protein
LSAVLSITTNKRRQRFGKAESGLAEAIANNPFGAKRLDGEGIADDPAHFGDHVLTGSHGRLRTGVKNRNDDGGPAKWKKDDDIVARSPLSRTGFVSRHPFGRPAWSRLPVISVPNSQSFSRLRDFTLSGFPSRRVSS